MSVIKQVEEWFLTGFLSTCKYSDGVTSLPKLAMVECLLFNNIISFFIKISNHAAIVLPMPCKEHLLHVPDVRAAVVKNEYAYPENKVKTLYIKL